VPRVWEESEITVLKDLAAAIIAEIEFRSAAREAADPRLRRGSRRA